MPITSITPIHGLAAQQLYQILGVKLPLPGRATAHYFERENSCSVVVVGADQFATMTKLYGGSLELTRTYKSANRQLALTLSGSGELCRTRQKWFPSSGPVGAKTIIGVNDPEAAGASLSDTGRKVFVVAREYLRRQPSPV